MLAGEAAFLGLLAASAGARIVASDATPGVYDWPGRLGVGPEPIVLLFLFVFIFLFVFVFRGPARPIQRFQHILDIAEVGIPESIDIVGRPAGCGEVFVEVAAIENLYGYAASVPGAIDQRHLIAQTEQGDCVEPADLGLGAVWAQPRLAKPFHEPLH